MLCPWTDFLQLGVVVPAFYPEIRQRKGPVLKVTRKLAADPFFQAMEFSGAEDPAVQKELIPLARASGKTIVFAGGSYCYLGQNNLHDLDEKEAGCFSRTFPTGKPVLSIEVIPPPGQNEEATLEGAKEAFRLAWEKFEHLNP